MRATVCLCLIAALVLLSTCDKSPTASRDTIPPARITSLTATDSTATTMTVRWQAVGDDSLSGRASAYDLRISADPITEGSWPASTVVPQHIVPGMPGLIEHHTITGLNSGQVVYAAIRAVDESGNRSALSNVVTLNVIDTIAPFQITDLHGRNDGDTALILSWTATGDDSLSGVADLYQFRYSSESITTATWDSCAVLAEDASPRFVGDMQSLRVSWPLSVVDIYCAVRAVDDQNQWSNVSNVIHVQRTTIPDSRIVWRKVYGGYSSLEPTSIAVTPDGSIFLLATVGPSDVGPFNLLAMKLDSGGNLVWSFQLGGALNEIGADIIPVAGGSCYVTGTTRSFGDTAGDGYIAALDPSGHLTQETVVGGAGAESVASAVRCADGGLALAGSVVAGDSVQFLLIKTDAAGTEEWRQLGNTTNTCWYEGVPPAFSFMTDVHVDSAGSIIGNCLTAYTEWMGITGCGPRSNKCQLRRYDLAGVPMDGWSYSDDFFGITYPGDFAVLADGSLSALTVWNTYDGCWVTRIAGWSSVHSVSFPELRNPPIPALNDVPGTNHVLVVGTIPEPPGSEGATDILLLHLGDDEAIVDSVRIGDAAVAEQSGAVAATLDGYAVIAGTRQLSAGEQRLLVAKVRLTP